MTYTSDVLLRLSNQEDEMARGCDARGGEK